MKPWSIHHGDALEVLRGMESGSFDACLCDPPYGLNFMGKAWDHGVPSADVWAEVLRVLKPGAHLLAFGGTRTFHRLTCAIEDAGFEVRDCISWLYGSGFPKSHNLHGDFEGYGTALKPAWEPCIVAMKPTDGTFAQNALEHGVAGLNIDSGWIATTDKLGGGMENGTSIVSEGWDRPWRTDPVAIEKNKAATADKIAKAEAMGRWPANLILDEASAAALDLQAGEVKSGGGHHGKKQKSTGRLGEGLGFSVNPQVKASSGGPSRFFYTAKASRRERDAGLDGFEKRVQATMDGGHVVSDGRDASKLGLTPKANHHPCLKPLDLCRYLASLILPPKRDAPRRILVPFSGSGSEMIGALLAGWDEAHGIEREAEYVAIAEARLAHWAKPEPVGLFDGGDE